MTESADATRLSFDVAPESEGVRLDRFLAVRIDGASRASLGRWIREQRVNIDGQPARKTGVSLRAGMRIVVDVPAPDQTAPRAESIPFEVLFEDDALIVIDKPGGLTVHPGHGRHTGTLVNGLLGRGVSLSTVGAPDRPGIVHRLDRETSGVMVVAKTELAHHALARAFASREVGKRYRALVWGHPRPDKGTIEREIGRSRNNPTKMAVLATRGRRRTATTHYQTLESIPGFGLLDIDIETGRTHQIRVHMEAIGHPVVGDERYGGRGWRGVQDPLKRKALREFATLALHAATLSFRHPSTGRKMRFTAALPPAFERLLSALREPR